MKDAKVSDLRMVCEQQDSDLWTVSGSLKAGGLELGCRMTVVRLTDGSLWLHSPVTLTDNVKDFLLDLQGDISDIVAPNSFHHLFVKPYLDQFGSRFWTVAAVQNKRPELKSVKLLTDPISQAWPQDFKLILIPGKRLQELVFLHLSSRTLILTDLAFNLSIDQQQGLQRWLMQKTGVSSPFGPSLFGRKFFFPKSQAVSAAISEVAAWDFDRIIMSHGSIVQSGGSAVFRDAFRSFLD